MKLANELAESQKADLNALFQDAENKKLLEVLSSFSATLKCFGYDVPAYNNASLQKLAEISTEQKIAIRTHFENWASWITPDLDGANVIEMDLEREKNHLKRALDHYGMWIHEEFWKTIQKNQIIEVYGSNMVQLYRNLYFFRFSSYSLLEISVFEWYHLWKRPSAILDVMMKDAVKCMTELTPVQPYHVPLHILRETKDANDELDHEPRASLVNFKNIGSVRRGLERVPTGAIATSEGEVIAIGSEAMQIQFV